MFLDEISSDAARDGASRPPGEATRLEGNRAFADGDLASAVALYTQSLNEAPPPSAFAAVVFGNRSAAYLALGRKAEALRDAQDSVYLSPALTTYAAKSRFRLGNAESANGQLERARVTYRSALDHAPGDRGILGKLKEVSETILAAERSAAAKGVETQMTPTSHTRHLPEHQHLRQSSANQVPSSAVTTATAAAAAALPASSASSFATASFPSSFSSASSSSSTVSAASATATTASLAMYNAAARAYRDGRFAEALELYDEMAASGLPLHKPHSFFGNRSATLLSLGRVEDALEDARKCVDSNPTYVKARACCKRSVPATLKIYAETWTRYLYLARPRLGLATRVISSRET